MPCKEIALVPLTDDRMEDFLALGVRPDQQAFVEPPVESLEDMRSSAWDITWTIDCILEGTQLIGYAMHGMSAQGDVWLDRFMIDARYQGRGLGHRSFQQLVQRAKECYPDRKRILLSVEKHNDFAISMYEHFGFRMTPYMDGIYPVMALTE